MKGAAVGFCMICACATVAGAQNEHFDGGLDWPSEVDLEIDYTMVDRDREVLRLTEEHESIDVAATSTGLALSVLGVFGGMVTVASADFHERGSRGARAATGAGVSMITIGVGGVIWSSIKLARNCRRRSDLRRRIKELESMALGP